jgi:predicted phosphodiesterase
VKQRFILALAAVVFVACCCYAVETKPACAAATGTANGYGPLGAASEYLSPSEHTDYLPIVIANTSACVTTTPNCTPTATPTFTATPTSTPEPTASATPTATPTLSPLIIGHITDAHIGGSRVYSERLPVAVEAVSKRADIIVDTGDCTDHGTATEASEYYDLVNNSAGLPWRAIPGNHDRPLQVFVNNIGPAEWTWDVGGYRLIGINTIDTDYDALNEALTTEKPFIVFGHYPLTHCNEELRTELRRLFKDYDVPIYIAGHTHLDVLDTDPESGTLLLTGQRAGLGHYRLITVQGFEVVDIMFRSAN